MKFQEFSAAQLARALSAVADDELDVVAFELQAADGSVIARDVLRLHVGVDHDVDRTGVYRWVRVTGRLER